MIEEKNVLNIDDLEKPGEVVGDILEASDDFYDYYSNLVDDLLKRREQL